MARNQYIFIDYENVCETDLSRISGKAVRVFMILGHRHTKLPTSLVLFAQDHHDQVRFIPTPTEGRNALDLVLSFELGLAFAADPAGYFHIVSKDTDFESVIRHLKGKTELIARHTSLTEIPCLQTHEQRIERIKQELKDPTHSRPATRQKLENKIQSAFQNQAPQELIQTTIRHLEENGILNFNENNKIQYKVA